MDCSASFRLWETGSPSSNGFKRFSRNPTLQLKYNYTPKVPSGEAAAQTSNGTGSVGCDQSSSSPPFLGHTASVQGPYAIAVFTDGDGDQVQGNVRYWNNSVKPVTYHTASQAAISTASTARRSRRRSSLA